MTQPSWIGYTLGGRYKIDSLLGQGGMSAVFKATDPNLRRTVAIKLIHSHLSGDPEFVRRFEAEAAAVAQLRHPHIIQVYDFNHDGDTYYMVLEYVPGETLQARLRRLNAAQERLPLAELLSIAASVCDAVDYAHQRGLIHRDIKPGNVMINPQGQPVLMDFGVAKILGEGQHTASGAVIGTASYISPEQVRGQRPDARSDLYSLGVTLFEMITGRPPFEADSAMTLMLMHVNAAVPDLRQMSPNTPAGVVAIVEKALAKEPADRFQTAAEMASALRSAMSTLQETHPASITVSPGLPQPGLPRYPPLTREALAGDQHASRDAVAPTAGAKPAAAARPVGEAPPLPSTDVRPPQAPPREALAAAEGAGTAAPTVEAMPAGVSASEVTPLHRAAAPGVGATGRFAEATRELPQPAAPPVGGPAEETIPAESRRSPVLLLAGLAGLICVVIVWFVAGRSGLFSFTGRATATQASPSASISTSVVQAASATSAPATPADTATAPPPPPTASPPPPPTPTLEPSATPIPFPEGMVLAPAGTFDMGTDSSAPDEAPIHTVTLDAFYMDQFEVTNARYKACVDAGACRPPAFTGSFNRFSYFGNPEFDNYPVVQVNWLQAQTFCEWDGGKRLPTEAEWEYAATGGDGRRYPWGNEFDPNRLPVREPDTTAAGTYPDGASPFGVYDMAGNVLEWVADFYSGTYYGRSEAVNPAGPPAGDERVLRGGSFGNLDRSLYTTTQRFHLPPNRRDADIGFRCALSVP